MNFDFNDEQHMFQETTRGFLERSYGLDRVRGLLEGDGFDRALWEGLVQSGAFSMLVPEEHGGMGLTFVDLVLVLEEYGRALVPGPVAETIICTDIVARFGTDEQKEKLLPLLAEGKLKIVPAIAEVDAGHNPAGIALSAVSSGSEWSVSGCKVLVPHAATADLIMLVARFGEGGPLGVVLIENNRQGVSLREHSTLDLSNRYHELDLDNVAVTRTDIVGGEPSDAMAARLLDVSSAVAAIMMTGIAGKVLDDTVEYVKQRTQFGKPIGSFQAIKHRCADMAVTIDASRSAAYYAGWALAEDAPDRTRAVSMAKSYSGDASRFVCNESVQLHGGMGFTWELGLHFYLRRAKVLEYSYGDAAYHRDRLLADTIDQIRLEKK